MATNRYNLDDIKNRIAAIQTEALSTTQQHINAVPYWPYQQEQLPYFCNRINSLDVDIDTLGVQDTVIDRYEIEMMMIVGHLGEGYQGEVASSMYGTYIPQLMDYFDQHMDLTTEQLQTYRTPPRFLWTQEGGAIIRGIPGGERTISNAGIVGVQHYLGFILEVPLLRIVY